MGGWRNGVVAVLVSLCLAALVAVATTSGTPGSDGRRGGLALMTDGARDAGGTTFPGAVPRRGTAVGAGRTTDEPGPAGNSEPTGQPGQPGRTDGSDGSDRPNVVVVLTDDQNDYDLRWMPLTRALVGDDGMEFTDAVSPHPLCCPARAELMTGQYAQNSGVRHNNGPYGGYPALDPAQTVGEWFQQAGYQTGFVGKYLNGYHARDGRDPGWTLWDPLVQGVYGYLDFSFYNDGRGVATYVDDYVTTAVEERTNEAVRAFARDDRPFLLYSFHLAPHYRFGDDGHPEPPPVEPRDRDALTGATPPSLGKPSFNAPTRGGVPGFLSARRERDPADIAEEFTARVRSLQSVDRAVASLVGTLQETGEWDDTYLVFTSDNGYSLGEHRFVGKNVLTEEALQVPLLVRGPGVQQGSTSQVPATLVDLPATLADLADVTPLREVDGSSLAPTLAGEASPFRDTTLVQTGSSEGDGWSYRGVRTSRYTYAVRQGGGDAVLYDRELDPFQLVNRADHPAYAAIRTQLETRRRQLAECRAWQCNPVFGQLPEPAATSAR